MVSERFLRIARAAVDEESFLDSWAQGRRMSYDAAVAHALENKLAFRPLE
jgi:hypothetical protein